VQNFTLKSARTFSNVVQSDQCNETARKDVGVYTASLCQPLDS